MYKQISCGTRAQSHITPARLRSISVKISWYVSCEIKEPVFSKTLNIAKGDPTTPGYPSYPNATRFDGDNIPKIPSLPISWENALRVLKAAEEGHRVRVTNSGKAAQCC